jgi:hypothetical protein
LPGGWDNGWGNTLASALVSIDLPLQYHYTQNLIAPVP